MRSPVLILIATVLLAFTACARLDPRIKRACFNKPVEITAIPLSPQNLCEPDGIPYYLPKPLLVVSKNFHHVQESRVGFENSVAPIPDSFDSQGQYGEVDATADPAVSPEPPLAENGGDAGAEEQVALEDDATETPQGEIPSDGLAPKTFFSFHILFVPDLTQKYGLTVRGGAGEMRAAMNLINGWQFTGLGPYYVKDSSKAQNIMASGIAANLALSGAGDVVRSVMQLREAAAAGLPVDGISAATEQLMNLARARATSLELVDRTDEQGRTLRGGTIFDFAEIYVFEPKLDPAGEMMWVPIPMSKSSFVRHFLAYKETDSKQLSRNLDPLLNSLESQLKTRVLGDGSTTDSSQPPQTVPFGAPRQSRVNGQMIEQMMQNTLTPAREAAEKEPGRLQKLFHHKRRRIESKRTTLTLDPSGQ